MRLICISFNDHFPPILPSLPNLAIFKLTLPFPSLLKFDQATAHGTILSQNLKRLFQVDAVPCDTYMRERLDGMDPQVLRLSFTGLFALLQRHKILEHFLFLDHFYLISLDGTDLFSSAEVPCENCCVKKHRDGSVTYYHQMLGAALVHPEQKVVYPFAPEPIMKSDGQQKNDCERNAAKRWLADFRREQPHLKAVILADGLAANEPFINLLRQHHLSFILVCKERDHAYLKQWIEAADPHDKPRLIHSSQGITQVYEYMHDVPLNDSKNACRVTVVCFKETKKGKTTSWMWVTDLTLTHNTIRDFVKGARSPWKMENETFNTLKNQGYEFEHNFGHGHHHLSTVFAHLMVLAFFIDQCLQHLNKRFKEALGKAASKKSLWQYMLHMVMNVTIPHFKTLYDAKARPPPFLASVI